MKITFCSDFHIGLRRSAHTTSGSQLMLQDHIYRRSLEVVTEAKEKGHRIINLGDLFDRNSNREEIVLQGLEVASLCDRVMAGNHDCLNIVDKIGSLQLVAKALEKKGKDGIVVMNDNLAEPYCFSECHARKNGELSITFIPHALNQELFEGSLIAALEQECVGSRVEGDYRILCLHCNLGENFGKVEAEGTTLCFTNELQKTLLDHFDLILLGHEHHAQTLHNGRIVVLGNLFPVSYGEIEDRFIYEFDSETLKLDRIPVFVAKDEFEEIDAEVMLMSNGNIDTSKCLVDVTGRLTGHEYPALSRALQNFWKLNHGSLFSVRNSVEIDQPALKEKDKDKTSAPRTMKELVTERVQGTGFEESYALLVGDIGE